MKAAYYCRVSTEEESQVNALDSQVKECINCINNNEWTLIDGYIDEGKSGTQTQRRDEYNRLFNDLDSDKFDVIVIKSQDRLMRNVKDWYLFIDKLTTRKKRLYFYLDSKFYTPDDALITGIKAILAEEYSRDLSRKLNNAHKNRQKNGKSVVITSSTWGYDKVNKKIVINEEEAKIVRLIFDLCIQGYGSRTISKELSNRGIKSRTGKAFPEITIRRIIRNPLFKGTAIMNKRHKDFNTKKTSNNPKEEWIYHDGIVPAIVSADIWNNANEVMNKRSVKVHSEEFSNRRIGKNIGKYDLSGKIICGECGSTYWRRHRKNVKKEQVVDWSCSEYVRRGRKTVSEEDKRGKNKIKMEREEGGCDNIHLKDEELNFILHEVAKDIFRQNKENLINRTISILRSTFSFDSLNEEIEANNLLKNKILRQKNLLLDKLLNNIISDEDYKRKDAELEDRLSDIIKKESKFVECENQKLDIEKRIENITEVLETDGSAAENVAKLIEHIIEIRVFNDHLEIYLDFYDDILVPIDPIGKKIYCLKSISM